MYFQRSHGGSVRLGLNPGTQTKVLYIATSQQRGQEELPFKYQGTGKCRDSSLWIPQFPGTRWSTLGLCCHMESPQRTGLILGGAVRPAPHGQLRCHQNYLQFHSQRVKAERSVLLLVCPSSQPVPRFQDNHLHGSAMTTQLSHFSLTNWFKHRWFSSCRIKRER